MHLANIVPFGVDKWEADIDCGYALVGVAHSSELYVYMVIPMGAHQNRE